MMKLLVGAFVALLLVGCGNYPGVPDFGKSLSDGVGEFLFGLVVVGIFAAILALVSPMMIGGIVGGIVAYKRKKGFWKGFWKGYFVGFEAILLLFICAFLIDAGGELWIRELREFIIILALVVVLIGGTVGGIVAYKRKKGFWKGFWKGFLSGLRCVLDLAVLYLPLSSSVISWDEVREFIIILALVVVVLIGGIVGGIVAFKRWKGFWNWKGVFVGFETSFLLAIFYYLIITKGYFLAVVVLIGGIVGGIVAYKRKKEVWKGVFAGLRCAYVLLPPVVMLNELLGSNLSDAFIVLAYLVLMFIAYEIRLIGQAFGGILSVHCGILIDANREEGNFTAYVSKDGQQYGPYTVEQLREYVQQGNFTTGDHACQDGQNWVTIAQVPGFADAGDSVTTPQQDQVVQEHAVEQQPASANASSSPAKKRKIILWTGIALVATLLVVGLLIWLLGDDEAVQDAQEKEAEASPQSNQSPASPPDAKIAQVGKIDLNDPKTRKKIIAKAVKHPSKMNLLQNRGKKGEELLYRKNQPKPYTGWTKWMGGNGRIRNLIHRKDGKKNGLAVWFYKNNGQKEGELNYKDGKKHGLMTWWYENGQKKAETTFTDDKVMTSVVWRPNGEKCPVTNVVNGNGAKVWYNNDGTVKRRVTYRDGEEVED